MKPDKAEGFARKRKARDKANMRWMKNRHGFFLAVAMGALVGGTVTATTAPLLMPYAVIAGAVTAGALAAQAIARNWFS